MGDVEDQQLILMGRGKVIVGMISKLLTVRRFADIGSMLAMIPPLVLMALVFGLIAYMFRNVVLPVVLFLQSVPRLISPITKPERFLACSFNSFNFSLLGGYRYEGKNEQKTYG